VGNILEHLARALNHHSITKIEHAREELVYNFGHAAEVAAKQIAQLYVRNREPAPHLVSQEGKQ
jgi:hypothetical protein